MNFDFTLTLRLSPEMATLLNRVIVLGEYVAQYGIANNGSDTTSALVERVSVVESGINAVKSDVSDLQDFTAKLAAGSGEFAEAAEKLVSTLDEQVTNELTVVERRLTALEERIVETILPLLEQLTAAPPIARETEPPASFEVAVRAPTLASAAPSASPNLPFWMPAKHASDAAWRTPERRAIMKRDWPVGIYIDIIMERLAACDGPDLPARADVGRWATNLNLRRPTGYQPNLRRPAQTGAVVDTPEAGVVVFSDNLRPAAPGVEGAPLTPLAPLALLPGRTRDGSISVASAVEVGLLQPGLEAIDPVALGDWARENKVVRGQDEDDAGLLRRVNAKRAALGLPPWALGGRSRVQEHLPSPRVGQRFGLPDGSRAK